MGQRFFYPPIPDIATTREVILMPEISKPIVLTIAGHDPSGGAGIQADIETIAALGCHAATCISCLTIQDSGNVYRLQPLPEEVVKEQVETLFNDYPIACIKLGLTGSAETANTLGRLLRKRPGIPLVLDPVLAAGGGTPLAGKQLITALLEQLIPLATLTTPNSVEARQLGGQESLEACAESLLARGCGAVLITGTHDNSSQVINRLYRPQQLADSLSWPRLEQSYHGSGCTLASAIAAGLAHGMILEEAVASGQKFTWDSLCAGWRPGNGQYLPDRLYSLRETH